MMGTNWQWHHVEIDADRSLYSEHATETRNFVCTNHFDHKRKSTSAAKSRQDGLLSLEVPFGSAHSNMTTRESACRPDQLLRQRRGERQPREVHAVRRVLRNERHSHRAREPIESGRGEVVVPGSAAQTTGRRLPRPTSPSTRSSRFWSRSRPGAVERVANAFRHEAPDRDGSSRTEAEIRTT